MILVVVESGIYLIAACLPAMHHLFLAMTPNWWRERTARNVAMVRLNDKLGQSSSSGPSKSHTGSRNRAEGSFTRLVDDEYHTKAGVTVGKPRQKMDVEDGKGGITVTTEISVRQEERIMDVLGM